METALEYTLRRCLLPRCLQVRAQGGRKERSGSTEADLPHVLVSRRVLPSGGTLGIPSHLCKAPFSTDLLGQAPCQLSPWQGNELGVPGSDWTHWTGTKTWEHNPGTLSHRLSCFLPGTGTPSSPRDKTESSCGRSHPVEFARASLAVCLRDAIPAARKISYFTANHIIYTEQRHPSVSSHQHSHSLSMSKCVPGSAMQTPKNQHSVNSNMGTKEREGGGAGEEDGCWNRRNRLWHMRDRWVWRRKIRLQNQGLGTTRKPELEWASPLLFPMYRAACCRTRCCAFPHKKCTFIKKPLRLYAWKYGNNTFWQKCRKAAPEVQGCRIHTGRMALPCSYPVMEQWHNQCTPVLMLGPSMGCYGEMATLGCHENPESPATNSSYWDTTGLERGELGDITWPVLYRKSDKNGPIWP